MPAGTTLTSRKSSHPYLRIVDFKDGTIDVRGLQFVPDDVFPRISRYVISTKDLYISIVGTVGVVGSIPNELDGANLTENAAKICEIDESKLDRRYLGYFLRSDEGQRVIHSLTVGSTQPKLALFRIEQIAVPCPSIRDQKRVANMLELLDWRIALLRETNATLEAIAQALFKSWFVDFDPVRAKQQGLVPADMDQEVTEFFPDQFGELSRFLVPSGWTLSSIGSICNLSWGNTTITKKSYVPEGVRAFSAAGQDGYVLVAERHGIGTVISAIGTVGNLHLAYGEWTAIKNTLTAQCSTDVESAYLHYLLRTVRFPSRGSTQQFISQSDARNIKFICPPVGARIAFGQIVMPLIERLIVNIEQAEVLISMRDLMLPRLISGQLRLPEAEAIAA